MSQDGQIRVWGRDRKVWHQNITPPCSSWVLTTLDEAKIFQKGCQTYCSQVATGIPEGLIQTVWWIPTKKNVSMCIWSYHYYYYYNRIYLKWTDFWGQPCPPAEAFDEMRLNAGRKEQTNEQFLSCFKLLCMSLCSLCIKAGKNVLNVGINILKKNINNQLL